MAVVPGDKPYNSFKMAIIKRTGRSDESILKDPFNKMEMDDRIPSQIFQIYGRSPQT